MKFKTPLDVLKSVTKSKHIEKTRRFIDLHEDKIKRFVKFSSTSLSDANGIINNNRKPGVLGYATLAAKVKSNYDLHLRTGNWNRFADNWDTFCTMSMAHPLTDVVLSSHEQDIVTLSGSRVLIKNDFVLAWNSTIEGSPHTPLYINRGGQEYANEFFKRIMWETLGKIIHVEVKRGVMSFLAQKEGPIFPSEVADKYSDEITKFLAKNHGRSMLFYGPPGTGKSNIVKNIVRNLGGNSIRFKYSDLQNTIGIGDIDNILEILQPDAVIVEDIDHEQDGGGNILHIMQTLNDRGKLVIMTANTIGKLSDASVRCGRFGKIVEIDKLDDTILRRIIKNDPELYDIVKDFPVAAVMEVMVRIDALGRKSALDDLDDIRKRVNAAKKNYSENKNSSEAATPTPIKTSNNFELEFLEAPPFINKYDDE